MASKSKSTASAKTKQNFKRTTATGHEAMLAEAIALGCAKIIDTHGSSGFKMTKCLGDTGLMVVVSAYIEDAFPSKSKPAKTSKK